MATTRLATGQLVVTGSAQPLSTVKTELKSFVVKAPSTNVATLYLGDPTVTTATGYPLAPGDSFVFDGNNEAGQPQYDLAPNDLYAVGTNPDVVAWIAAGRNG